MKEYWKVKKLGEVCEVINGFAFKSTLFKDDGEPILRISNIQNGIITLENVVYFEKKDYKVKLDKYKVYPNDILIALSGATTGKVGVNRTNLELYLNQRVALCREKEFHLRGYLYYFLQTKTKELLSLAGGVAQPNLSTEQIKNLDIYSPSLDEQSRIVEELDLLSNIIEKKRQQLSELDNFAQSIFYDMFGDPVTNEKGWEVKKLGEVCVYKSQIERANKYFSPVDIIQYIDISSINNSDNTIYHTNVIKFVDAPSRAQQRVVNNDVLISLVRPNLKNVALVNNSLGNLVASTGFCVLRTTDLVSPYYILFSVLNDCFTKYLMDRTSGANYPAVREEDIKGYDLCIPPLTLQQLFAKKIEAIEKQKALIKQSVAETEELFNSRMDYYFS